MTPIPIEPCIVTRDITEPQLHPAGTALVYALSAGGAAALMLDTLDGGPPRQLTAAPPPRPGRGLGGGCWCWTHDGAAVIYAAVDGDLWLQPVPWGAVRRLTSVGEGRSAAAPAVLPDGTAVVYAVDSAEIWMTRLDDCSARRLDAGAADFVLDPAPSPDGSTISWHAWSVPDMAWDASVLEHVRIADGARWRTEVGGSVQQARYLPDGRLMCVRDDSGWNNVWLDRRPLVEEPFEHAGPSWGMGQRSFAVSPDGRRVAFTRNEAGFGRLCVVHVDGGAVETVARGVHGQLSWSAGRLAAIRTGARTPTQVVVYDDTSWERTVVAVGPLSGWEDADLAEPELVEVAASDGTKLHARLYRADASSRRLLCWIHGGPTDQWQVTFMPRIAYWRAQGWNVVVPDHRGSTGHGRDYQQAMRGRWGELDVSDTAAILRDVQQNGVGVPASTAVVGSSAGGFTALWLAARHAEALAAVVAAYPVTDLIDLGRRSHRFEAHYNDSLVGTLPDAADRYRERSPIEHAAAFTSRPILLMHGDADPVVPVEHSIAFAEACRAAGGDVELVVYEGEGHGFRTPENQHDEYQRMAAFLGRTVGPG